MGDTPHAHGPMLRGEIHAFFVFDAGFQIDLTGAGALLREGMPERVVRLRRPSPAWFEYEKPPLRLGVEAPPVHIAPMSTEPGADCLIYDFGAAVVSYTLRFHAAPSSLVAMVRTLYDNPALLDDARVRLKSVLSTIDPAIAKPSLSEQVEDYVIISVRDWPEEVTPAQLIDRHAADWARVLQAEVAELDTHEVQRTLTTRVSYTPQDAAVIDWHAALLIDRAPEDMIAVLRHANVELLEMRLLDQRLDRLLGGAYDLLHRVSKPGVLPALQGRRALSRFAEIQADSALMFEGVNNAIKLLGDQYLARVYRMASTKLDLPAWDESVLRKIATAESVYQKLTDAESTRRMEVLEIVIIVLILISIVMPFIPGIAGH